MTKINNIYTLRLLFITSIDTTLHQDKSLSGFTPGLLSPEADALKLHVHITEQGHQNCHHYSEIAPP